ncbi:MAG: BT_3928 family protein [Bacteroidota bacterium]
MNRQKIITLFLWVSRILFGVVFIFSGFVKAVDPLGSTYKFQDYFLAFNAEWLFPLALPLSVLLSALEFIVGASVLMGVKMKYASWGGLLFMLFFTPLTLYIAIADPVPDCGCFGDALIISNWETFYKNLIILAAIIFIFVHQKSFKPIISAGKDWLLPIIFTVFILFISFYSLRNLPILDFRPWKKGNNIYEQLTPVQEQIAEYIFVYENPETGEQKEFSVDELHSDPWVYLDRKEKIIQEFIDAPITNFYIQDEYGDDYTDSYIANPDFQFVVVAYDLGRTHKKTFEKKINEFASLAEIDGVSFIVLTGSTFETMDEFRHEVQASYPFYQSDGTALKTIVRSNPGMLLLHNGVVVDKWHYSNIPSYPEVKEKYLQKDETP